MWAIAIHGGMPTKKSGPEGPEFGGNGRVWGNYQHAYFANHIPLEPYTMSYDDPYIGHESCISLPLELSIARCVCVCAFLEGAP